ncbi:MAG: TolC family protein [Balneolales bacterium]
MSFDNAVELSLANSYQIQYLEIGVLQTRRRLEAERANLRSRIDMDLTSPDFQIVSEQKFDSELQRDVLIRENTRMWRMDLSVRQPVILFGYPTNGYLSLNNRVYRFSQLTEGEGRNITYYNRYFIAYEQPLFQPNELKNDLEVASLNLEDEELEYLSDVVSIIEDVADDYYDLFETVYERLIVETQLENLEQALEISRGSSDFGANTVNQLQVELTNVQENLAQTNSDIRLDEADIKQELRLDESTFIEIDPVIEINPILVNIEQAIEFGRSLRPRMRELEIEHRRQEIDLEEVKGQGGLQMNLETTYGREMQDPRFGDLLEDPTNSYTLGVNVRIPILDWGERRARIQAEQLGLSRIQLEMEEEVNEIQSNIKNAVETLQTYQNRALAMQENVQLARSVMRASFEAFQEGEVGVFELLQNIQRLRDTQENLLQSYLGYRNSILNLWVLTFYDFETGQTLLDRYNVVVQE